MPLQTNWTLVKTEDWFPTVGSLATMSSYYKPFDLSGPPTKLKEATIDPMNFCSTDEVLVESMNVKSTWNWLESIF